MDGVGDKGGFPRAGAVDYTSDARRTYNLRLHIYTPCPSQNPRRDDICGRGKALASMRAGAPGA